MRQVGGGRSESGGGRREVGDLGGGRQEGHHEGGGLEVRKGASQHETRSWSDGQARGDVLDAD